MHSAFVLTMRIVNGSGAGMPLGIMNSGALVAVSKEAGQNPSTFVYHRFLRRV